MKKKCLYSCVIFLVLTLKSFGQWVVADPTLAQLTQMNWTKDLAESAKKFKVLTENKDLLTASLDLYRKVNSKIKNSKTVWNILERQGSMLAMSAKECDRKDIYSKEAYQQYVKTINGIIDEANISFELLQTLISPALAMTDGERLKIILEIDTKTKEAQNKLRDERRRFNQVNDAVRRIAALKSE